MYCPYLTNIEVKCGNDSLKIADRQMLILFLRSESESSTIVACALLVFKGIYAIITAVSFVVKPLESSTDTLD